MGLKRFFGWQAWAGILLVLLSAILYYADFMIFHKVSETLYYLLGSLAFMPLEVLLVTIILHQLLVSREKSARLEKLNMVIGAFFSEMGTPLLTLFSDYDPCLEEIKKELVVQHNWTDREFSSIRRRLKKYDYSVDIKKFDLQGLKTFLVDKRGFMLRLIENPNLLEHEAFTDLLWAVFHFTEELASRKSLIDLPHSDLKHLENDVKRVYVLLVWQWLDYMKHLKENYPHLFSLAIRMNPFDETASPIVSA
ncbi:MAG TPA: hypothetical protein VMD02_06835 [Candidatus Omnitrophota bacterium]|nr:hypothetical protein [Candidatus Omnitrophota bacterium]